MTLTPRAEEERGGAVGERDGCRFDKRIRCFDADLRFKIGQAPFRWSKRPFHAIGPDDRLQAATSGAGGRFHHTALAGGRRRTAELKVIGNLCHSLLVAAFRKITYLMKPPVKILVSPAFLFLVIPAPRVG